MGGTHSVGLAGRALEFGIYRDGDNDLDEIQANLLTQARTVSARNPAIEFLVEDTTSRRGFAPRHVLRTESYAIAGGELSRRIELGPPHDMSDAGTLAHFVRRTLDRAQINDARQTWIELVDHGAGDGGGLEADHGDGIMAEDDMAKAIADGVAAHARAHPEDAGRRVDGVFANECLMGTLGMASALSHAGVRFLAASPETMLAPGAPSNVADAIARHVDDPKAMAKAVVEHVMKARYDLGDGERFSPAAAFDVFDLDPEKVAAMEHSVRDLNAKLADAAQHRSVRTIVREDARQVEGMTRFPGSGGLPWRGGGAGGGGAAPPGAPTGRPARYTLRWRATSGCPRAFAKRRGKRGLRLRTSCWHIARATTSNRSTAPTIPMPPAQPFTFR
jgi:hypothetical protein